MDVATSDRRAAHKLAATLTADLDQSERARSFQVPPEKGNHQAVKLLKSHFDLQLPAVLAASSQRLC